MSIELIALPMLAAGMNLTVDSHPLPAPQVVLVAQAAAAVPGPALLLAADPPPPRDEASADTAPPPTAAGAAGADPLPPAPMPPRPGNGSQNGDNGVIVVTGRQPIAADPVEAVNIESFKAVQAVDRAVIGPVTHGYMKAVPKPVQMGVRNALNNLDEPVVFINFLLQLKIGKAIETAARFAINSTVGVAGLVDVAKRKPFNLPRRSNGLADTLGYYGVGPGPYLFLPVIGSTTLRDLIARPFDLAVLPVGIGKPFTDPAVSLGKGVLSALDERADYDETLTRLRDESPDPYAATRDYYLAKRKAEIEVLKGKRKSIYDPPFYDLEHFKVLPSPTDAPRAPALSAPDPVALPRVEKAISSEAVPVQPSVATTAPAAPAVEPVP